MGGVGVTGPVGTPWALKAPGETLASKAPVVSVLAALLVQSARKARKDQPGTRAGKGRRSLDPPAPLAGQVPRALKAQPEIRAREASPRLAWWVQPGLPVRQVRKAQLARRVHKAPPV